MVSCKECEEKFCNRKSKKVGVKTMFWVPGTFIMRSKMKNQYSLLTNVKVKSTAKKDLRYSPSTVNSSTPVVRSLASLAAVAHPRLLLCIRQ